MSKKQGLKIFFSILIIIISITKINNDIKEDIAKSDKQELLSIDSKTNENVIDTSEDVNIDDKNEKAENEEIENVDDENFTKEFCENVNSKNVETQNAVELSNNVTSENTQNVNQKRTREKGTISVDYVDIDTNIYLMFGYKETGFVGDSYITRAYNIENYELVKIPDNAKGKFKKGHMNIIYYYRKGG